MGQIDVDYRSYAIRDLYIFSVVSTPSTKRCMFNFCPLVISVRQNRYICIGFSLCRTFIIIIINYIYIYIYIYIEREREHEMHTQCMPLYITCVKQRRAD